MPIPPELKPKIDGEHIWGRLLPEANRSTPWPFTIRWLDEKRIDRWLSEGFSGKNLIVLGPPQALAEPGIRVIAPIVEMAQTMEIMKKNPLGLPSPSIFCPIYINSQVNQVSVRDNEIMAQNYLQLARKYFSAFHPDLPLPGLITDKTGGVKTIMSIAAKARDVLSVDTMNKLLTMADKHHNGVDKELLTTNTTAYLLAHYVAYGYLSLPEYYHLNRDTLMLVPQSESRFHSLIDKEIGNLKQLGLNFAEPTETVDGQLVIGYSSVLETAHYYPHRGEPTLKECQYRWPTKNQLSHKNGLNGNARSEIISTLNLIENDIGGRTRIKKLQSEVIGTLSDPYRANPAQGL